MNIPDSLLQMDPLPSPFPNTGPNHDLISQIFGILKPREIPSSDPILFSLARKTRGVNNFNLIFSISYRVYMYVEIEE